MLAAGSILALALAAVLFYLGAAYRTAMCAEPLAGAFCGRAGARRVAGARGCRARAGSRVFASLALPLRRPSRSRAPSTPRAPPAAVWSFLAGALLVAAVVLALLDVGLPSLKGLVAQVAEAVRGARACASE
jgi:hypothetical protein